MNGFVELKKEDYVDVNGGGAASAVAGTLAGALIGTFGGLIPAAKSGDLSIIGHSAILGASAGFWVGCGMPLP